MLRLGDLEESSSFIVKNSLLESLQLSIENTERALGKTYVTLSVHAELP